MDIKDIQNLIKFVSKADVAEVSIKDKEFEIKIKTLYSASNNPVQQTYVAPLPVQQALPAQEQPAESALAAGSATPTPKEDKNYITIKSPMIGTFYRASGPGKEPFVNVGDTINNESVICIIEAMKLFNEIEAEVSGKIVKVLVDDATPVEFDQPLFLVDPS